MTPEQLDEIERLAEAQEFLRVGAYALPLVKALREARAALDQVSSDDRMSEAQILATIRHAQAQKDEAIRQRDEARAEVERLRVELVRTQAAECKLRVLFAGLPPDGWVSPAVTPASLATAEQVEAALKEGDR